MTLELTVRGGRSRGRELELVAALAGAALRARYGRGPFRIVKWLLDPLALLGVYLALVTFVLDRPGDAPGLSLACAVVPFQFMAATVTNSLTAVSLHRSVVLNMGFARSLIPVATTLTELAGFGAALVLVFAMLVPYGIAPTLALLWLPVLVAQNAVVALALAFPSTLFGLYFRDLHVFAISGVRALFFLSAGLVPLASITGTAPTLLRLNPFTGLFESFRSVFLYGEAPAAWELGYPLAFAAFLLAVFVPLYRREEAQFAKVVE